MTHKKISLVGGGNIGATLANLLLQRRLGSVVLYDIEESIPQGKALDLLQAVACDGLGGGSCLGTNNPADIKDSDIVVVTAGLTRKPGMSRDDLLAVNGKIIKEIGKNIAEYCPKAFVIVVTNPLDVMVCVLHKYSGLPSSQVVGMAGILDSSRFVFFLSEALKVAPNDIQTLVLGGHGDLMVPLPRYTSIAGIPLNNFIKNGTLSQQKLNDIIERTKNGGAEIVALLKKTSAFYAPASSVCKMIEAYLYNQKRLLPCAAYLNGEYGEKNIYAGVPVIIGSRGVEKVIELSLQEDESAAFKKSLESVKNLLKDAERLGL